MPRRDGTGPTGQGPIVGRGRGRQPGGFGLGPGGFLHMPSMWRESTSQESSALLWS